MAAGKIIVLQLNRIKEHMRKKNTINSKQRFQWGIFIGATIDFSENLPEREREMTMVIQ